MLNALNRTLTSLRVAAYVCGIMRTTKRKRRIDPFRVLMNDTRRIRAQLERLEKLLKAKASTTAKRKATPNPTAASAV
jgi:hypothetical protein